MLSRSPRRVTAALVASCCLAGGIATSVSGAASAQTAASDATWQRTSTGGTAHIRTTLARGDQGDGVASMSSPYIVGVPHVPANVGVAVSPEGAARYIGPEGSIFDGPAATVGARVNAWWEQQMAAGVTPEEADEMLASMSAGSRIGARPFTGLASMWSPFIPGVPHVPASAGLVISPGQAADYTGPVGSMFRGSAAQVEARVAAWWADQMAAGATPEEADLKLVELSE